MPLFCEYNSLLTESDVEQKFIYPFLTSLSPIGLSLADVEILTKKVLRQRQIGKGQTQKYYYPDYLIMIRGIPVLVVEAKKPNEELSDAYAEARLYAEEVNAGFPHNVNVCQYIIVCNGTKTWAGYSDHAEPTFRLDFDDFNVENVNYVNLLDFCSRKKLEEIANKPYIEARGKAIFNTPVSALGGKRVQNEELEENSFGRTLIFEDGKIFDPETEQERLEIVENAYVPSAKREQHIEPIYREIQKFELPSRRNSTAIATENPKEIVDKIYQRIDEKIEAYSLMLLIGNVGSGKTTFIRYFKKVFLEKNHKNLSDKCEWIFINMNPAPVNSDEIYEWVKRQIIDQIKLSHSETNFDDIDVIKKLFRNEIHKFESGLGRLILSDQTTYNKELFTLLSEKTSDTGCYLEALIEFIKDFHSLIPIIVLDNCDKRNKDEQLLMFQVAQWLRTQYKCIVILPMRDSTYDNYRDEPPLDTVVKDLVFRIDPPDLLKVLQARLDYIFRITNQEQHTYLLQNGIQVLVKRSELVEYFRCIMLAIRKNRWALSIFYRLSDRNMRKGIQLFEDFCKSGHIKSDDIFMIRSVGDNYEIPSYKLLNAFLRKNRRYYNGEQSNFVNLFYSNFNDDFPDPFIRIDILLWLKTRVAKGGPSKIKGMFPVTDLIKDMLVIGHDIKITYREINYLVKRGLIFSENLLNSVEYNDLIKIAIPGFLHLSLLNDVCYLAACAEDVLFKNTEVMMCISKRLATQYYLSKLSIVATADDLVRYLDDYRHEFTSNPEVFLANDTYKDIYDLSECKSAIANWIDSDTIIKRTFQNLKSYPIGTQIVIKVVNKNNGGIICVFDGDIDIKGFISAVNSKYQLNYDIYESINVGDNLHCEVLEYDYEHKSFQLKFVNKIDVQDINMDTTPQ